jgi:hypothetical protein
MPQTPTGHRLYNNYKQNMRIRDEQYWQQELEKMKADREKCTFRPNIDRTFDHHSNNNMTPNQKSMHTSRSPYKSMNRGNFHNYYKFIVGYHEFGVQWKKAKETKLRKERVKRQIIEKRE